MVPVAPDALLAGLGLAALTAALPLLVGLFVALHQVRRLRARLDAAMAATGQGVLLVDVPADRIVWNRSAAQVLDLPPALLRRPATVAGWRRWHQATRGLPPPVAALLQPETPIAPACLSRPDGTVYAFAAERRQDGIVAATLTDVTPLRAAERALAEAQRAAEAAEKRRAGFFAVMSHEMRTPLNGILGMTGLMLDMQPAPEERHYLELVRKSGDQLLELITDLLDFCRLDAGRLERDDAVFELPRRIADSVALLERQADAKGLTLTCSLAEDLPRWVVADPGRLRQVLLHLIGNAVKFTERGEVTVTARVASRSGETARIAITVRDTGIGIAPSVQARLFQPFSQADGSMSRRFGGTGLGLAICRGLAGHMGGTLTATSTPQEGSVFRLCLPCRTVETPPRNADAEETPGIARRLRVLLAEDNDTNRLVAVRVLERLGHRVDAVGDGAEAVRALGAAEYELVLMDVMMPVMDGLAASRAIRAMPAPRGRTPIVGLTANAQPEDEKACRAAGMDGFVAKPFTADRLAAAITRAVPPPPSAGDAGVPGASTGPLLDSEFLARLAADIGTDGALEAIALFREDGPARIAQIRGVEEDPSLLRREAHALAGAARNLGLVALGRAAGAMQRTAERARPDAVQIEALAGLVAQSLTALTAWETEVRGTVAG
ncbi:MAG: hypothetical protein BGO51_09180 [Rhodospirillales bacterium 69-11]|nr:response regulator [Rhodospirillales bacterium]OJW26253.1 MAG: hypothetical protein BGO51_09180 [Rhodospirillales bacterium 69-11]